MSSVSAMKSSAKKVLIVALISSFLFTLCVAFLNEPVLKPAKFWSVVNADQSMSLGYMLKQFGEVHYAKDFSFTVDPNIYQLYNPLELSILHRTFLLFDKNIPATFYSLLLIFSFGYFLSIFIVTYFFSGSFLAAVIVSLFSSVWQYMGFCADAWGMAVVENARSAYYVLPLLVLSALFVIRTYESDNAKKIVGSFFTVGLVAWMHPVTGYHWAAVSWTIGLMYDIVMNRRFVFFSFLRIVGYFVGSLPTFISLIHNELFGVGSVHQAKFLPGQIWEASKIINPTYVCHVMPYVLGRFPRPLQPILVPGFKVIIIAGVLVLLYTLIRLVRAGRKQSFSSLEHRRLFVVLYVVASILFVGFTAMSNPLTFLTRGIGLYVSFATLIAGISFVLVVNLIRIWNSERPSSFDTILLGIMSFSLLFSIAGSWVINVVLDQINYPQRFFEQMRGIRIAYLVFLIWSASSLTYFLASVSFRRIGFFLVALFGLLTLHFYARSFSDYHRAAAKEEVNFYEMSDWVRRNTDPNCLTAFLTGDPWQKASELAGFKALAQRSLTYSYDCYQLAYTAPDELVPALQRMDDVAKASQTPHGVEQYLVQYKPDYVVMTRDQLQMNSVQNIVYQNESYTVVRN